MNKAEMEDHRNRYLDLMAEASSAERVGLYRVVVEKAMACWEHIDGMMRYERKYGDKGFTSVPAIDLILKYAPLLLDFAGLNKLEDLLKDYRLIEKHTTVNLGDKLDATRALMWDVHRLWDYLEQNPNSRQDELRRLLGGRKQRWQDIVEAWEKMGLLRRKPEGATYRLVLATRMGEVVSAKCPACGELVEAPKATCLEETACPKCEKRVLFVILSTRPASKAKE